jgi:putative ABC transport system ATP-binding protein
MSPKSPHDVVLEISQGVKTYHPGAVAVRGLDRVSLSIRKGELLAIMGPSGSGKSTLLNCLGCLDTLDAGEVFVDGQAVSKLSPTELAKVRAERIGFIFQSFNLVPVLSALENVELALEIRGTRGRIARDQAMSVLERVGLAALAHRRPGQLSGGQQQRVAIARALVKEPAVVLADEPTANLDRATSEEIVALMREMNDALDVAFVLATHDERLMKVARRVVRVEDGRIAYDGPPSAPVGAAS